MGKDSKTSYSQLKISSRYLYRNLSDYYDKVSARFDSRRCKVLSENFNGKQFLDFIPMKNFEYFVFCCPVDLNDYTDDEYSRSTKKIDFVIESCRKKSYEFSLGESMMFDNRKEMMMFAVITYVLNFLLQLNQDIDLELSTNSTTYLFKKLSELFKNCLGVSLSERYISNFIYSQFSKDCMKFKTVDSSDKLKNVSDCYVDDGTLVLMFEMPRRF